MSNIPFDTLEAIGLPVDIPNCDTDRIIPARFLRYLPSDGGYDRYLFHDLRFDGNGDPRPDFIYNRAPYDRAELIVADVNWGCGSSREHAVYALQACGMRCVIAPSFGDIHYGNCVQKGVLPVRLDRATCDRLRAMLHERPGATLRVDLPSQIVTAPDGTQHAFEIAAFDKHRLLNGLDDIGLTLEHAGAIERFERTHFAALEWAKV